MSEPQQGHVSWSPDFEAIAGNLKQVRENRPKVTLVQAQDQALHVMLAELQGKLSRLEERLRRVEGACFPLE